FRRALVMAAAGGMDVMIAGVPPVRRRIDPAPELEFDVGGGHPHRAPLGDVLRSAPAGECIVARRQPQRLAVFAVYLLLKEKVRGEALRARRIHAAEPILDDERRHRRAAALVAHTESDVM